ncbi:MAG: hypothetical protein LUH14_03995 [Clostridiaceae bacterium]|nr:hypothetical protein [Clostridiaceae bacterium]
MEQEIEKDACADQIAEIRQKAKKDDNKTLYFISNHLELYGAIRSDVLNFYRTGDIVSINVTSVLKLLGECLKTDMDAAWYVMINETMRDHPDSGYYFLYEIKAAYDKGISVDEIKDCARTAQSPYVLHVAVQKIQGNTDDTSYYMDVLQQLKKDQENHYKEMAAMEEIKKAYEQAEKGYIGQIENLKKQLEMESDISVKIISFIKSYFEENRELKDQITQMQESGTEEFDESLVPGLEEEISMDPDPEMDFEILPEFQEENEEEPLTEELPKTDLEESGAEVAISEENTANKQQEHQKRLSKFFQAILRFEKKRFLSFPQEKQKEVLIAKILEKKYSGIYLKTFKDILDTVSCEYAWDLVVRNASLDELKNILLLKEA